jgi:hypothetical protein
MSPGDEVVSPQARQTMFQPIKIEKYGLINGLKIYSIIKDGEWVQDISKHSFCLWDLEIFWKERNSYIKHVYSDSPHIGDYRKDFVAESADFVNASD